MGGTGPVALPGSKPWLDDDGRFLFGKYRGQFAGEVAADDPGYVRWVVEEAQCMSEDRERLRAFLAHPQR